MTFPRPTPLTILTATAPRARYDDLTVPETLDHPLISVLNDEQRAAATHFQGPALVLAGAGSGKTRTVVHRIAYLMDAHEVYPTEILAVTFTNKAAGELKERVAHLMGGKAKDLWVSTFHSACLRVLRNYGPLIGLESGFAIYDDTDQLEVLKEILERVSGLGDANPRVLRSLIDRAKSNLWTPSDLLREGERVLGGMVAGLPLDLIAEAYGRYSSRLRQANAVDFNDILGRTVELFDAFPDVLQKVQQRAVFIHVDEYQDTNTAQYRLTKLLASSYGNLMVVGDPDQSIYAFRGADVRNILDFREDYPEAAVYRLELNYRSVSSVLELANTIITANEGRLEKNLRPVKGIGEPVKIYRASDHRAEGDFVARQIERLQSKDLTPNSFAVLYRTNSQSRVLEESLRRAGIPAKIVGGVGFYERREVKDTLSYARAALNPADDIAWRRTLNRPKRGIGKTSEDKLVAWAAKHTARFSDALRQSDEILRGTPAVKRIGEFVELMDDLKEAAETLPAAQFLKAVIDQSGYMQALKDEKSFEAQGRIENLGELITAVTEWQEETGGSIAEFLDEAALLASVDDRAVKAVNQGEVPEEAVTLMTLHNAKGLEFPVVFLVGMEENLIPHRSSTGSLQEIEEERRLLYVGITRAQETLFLVNSESRMSFGRTEFARPSRFLEDVPKTMLKEIDIFGVEMGETRLNKYSRAVWAPPSASPKADADDTTSKSAGYRGGEKVTHPKFGAGTVVGVSGEGPRAEITVVFKEAGPKRLLLKYANLSPTA
ncbi:MAG: ATP-dependent DNA helicase UvrD/PcrA [uncultured Truepera sp.]|uniref:DNA 3'-5' helicase n=1 Tax=uncultured Truepera sp. TaxID=543023 RepID=A0A6J4VWF2_9DEIN|nr:MAG: ATP-dependent DNA helicase UvrD/PcrA [uncultured Truepera sp.]